MAAPLLKLWGDECERGTPRNRRRVTTYAETGCGANTRFVCADELLSKKLKFSCGMASAPSPAVSPTAKP